MERKLMKTMFVCSKAQRKFITLRNSTLYKWNESNLIYDRKGPLLDWATSLKLFHKKAAVSPSTHKHICSSVFANSLRPPEKQPDHMGEETKLFRVLLSHLPLPSRDSLELDFKMVFGQITSPCHASGTGTGLWVQMLVHNGIPSSPKDSWVLFYIHNGTVWLPCSVTVHRGPWGQFCFLSWESPTTVSSFLIKLLGFVLHVFSLIQ